MKPTMKEVQAKDLKTGDMVFLNYSFFEIEFVNTLNSKKEVWVKYRRFLDHDLLIYIQNRNKKVGDIIDEYRFLDRYPSDYIFFKVGYQE